jgi:hypothetical protein
MSPNHKNHCPQKLAEELLTPSKTFSIIKRAQDQEAGGSGKEREHFARTGLFHGDSAQSQEYKEAGKNSSKGDINREPSQKWGHLAMIPPPSRLRNEAILEGNSFEQRNDRARCRKTENGQRGRYGN